MKVPTTMLSCFVLCYLLFNLLSCVNGLVAKTDPSLADEWVGPLPGWKWVTTDFGAKGDGVTDDSGPIQRALNSALVNEFIYFPPGTYIITKMLNMTSSHYSTIVGHDPTNTIIKYNGKACFTNTFNCVMLYTNGVMGMKFARLTWDGNNKIHTCVQNRWDGIVTGYSGDGVHEDEIFKNAYFGLRAGSNHSCTENCATAEWSVVRSQFINLSYAGFSIEDWNALDWFIRQCVFTDCYYGATNLYGMGGFHVYESQFFSSVVADVGYGNCEYFSIRDNFSWNSTKFIYHADIACQISFSIQNNIVVAPLIKNNAGLIYFGGPEAVSLLDNVFITRPAYTGPAIIWNSQWAPSGSMVSINNTFGTNGDLASAILYEGEMTTTKRVISIQDSAMDVSDISYIQPTIPGFQPVSTRKIFTIPPPSAGINNTIIQDVITAASAYVGQRPIVYLAMGKYLISQSITFPPNSDIQLMGRERASWWDVNFACIQWQGAKGQPIIHIQGPSKVTVKFLTMWGQSVGDAIWISNADQVGARVYVENFNPYHPFTHSFYGNHLDNVHVDFYQLFHGGIPGWINAGMLAVGGPCANTGKGDFRVASYGGASGADSTTGSLYDVRTGGRMSITDIWYEGNGIGWFNTTNSKGTFSLSGANVAPYYHTSPTLTLNNFHGRFLLANVGVAGNVAITTASAETDDILFANDMFLATKFQNTGITSGYYLFGCDVAPDGNANDAKTYLASTLPASYTTTVLNAYSLLRSATRSPVGSANNRPNGITNVRLFRNWEVECGTALRIDGNLTNTVCSL